MAIKFTLLSLFGRKTEQKKASTLLFYNQKHSIRFETKYQSTVSVSILLVHPVSSLCDGGDNCCDHQECGVSLLIGYLQFFSPTQLRAHFSWWMRILFLCSFEKEKVDFQDQIFSQTLHFRLVRVIVTVTQVVWVSSSVGQTTALERTLTPRTIAATTQILSQPGVLGATPVVLSPSLAKRERETVIQTWIVRITSSVVRTIVTRKTLALTEQTIAATIQHQQLPQ